MAKALKTAGMIVAGAALVMTGVGAIGGLAAGFSAAAGVAGLGTAVGISAGTLFSISAGLSLGSSLLAPRVKAPDVSSANQDRLTASIDPRASRKILFGSTALATDIRDQEYTEGQKYLHRWIAVASHKIHAVREIWFDGELAWSAAGGVQGKFAPWLQVQIRTEGTPANAINIGARMGSSRRFTGCAYVYLRYQILAQSKKTDSVFHQSIPSRIIIVGDAAYLYDPRLDSTVGGSGPMRANDQTTWSTSWTADRGRNPILQMLFYLLGYRIQNPATGEWKLAVGRGYPPERIDMQSFITAANLCDEPVQRAVGGTEPRYRSDGIFSEGDDPQVVLDNLKATANAVLDDVDGKIRVSVLHNDLAAPIGDLTEDDVIGGFEWEPSTPLLQSYNVYRGGFTDPSTRSLYQLIDCPEIRIPSPDGIDRAETVNLPLVQSPSQWQRLVSQRAQRNLYPGLFRATFQATAWRFQKGDVVRFRFAPLGWDYRLFRIVDAAVQVDGLVPMVLRVEHASIYAWDGSDAAAIVAAEPFTYDAQLGPMALAIGDAGETAVWSAIADDNARKPEDNATKGAVIGENISLPGEATPLPREELITSEGTSADTNAVGSRPSAELLAQIDQTSADLAAVPGTVERIDATIETLTNDVNERVDQVDGRVDLTVQRQSAAERASRQLDRQLADIGKSLLRVAVEADRTRATFRDAGIHVDPDNGEVRIEAIDQTAERVAQAQLRLTAAEAAIQLRVTAAYVNEKIIEAVLDPSQVAELEEVFLRITAAEQTLSALDATIVTKADAQTLTDLGLVVTDVTETIDALNGLIESKAETSTVEALGTRVGAVETTLDSMGDVVGVSSEIRQVRYAAGLTGKALLEAIVAGDELKRGQVQSQALIQSQLTTTINDKVGAEAASRLALAVEVGAARADMVDERAVRAAADRAEAAARSAMGLQFGQANAAVLDQIDLLVQADSAQVERTDQIAGELEDQAADITEIRELDLGRDKSIASITTAVRQSRVIGGDAARSLLSTIVAADEAKRQSLVASSNLFSQVTSEITAQGEVKTRELRRLEAMLTGVDSALKAAVTSLNQAIVNGDGAQASALQSVAAALETVQGDLDAAVTRLDQVNVDQDTATSESLDLVVAAIDTLDGNIVAAVTDLNKAIVDGDSAQASALEEVSTSLGDLQGSVQTLAETVIEQGDKVRSFLESSVTAGGSTALVRIWAEQSPGVRASGIDLQADFITLGQRRALEITPNGIRANVNLAAGARFTLGVGVGWEVATKPRTFEASDGETIAFGLTFSSPPGYLPIVPTGLAPLGEGESYSLTLDPISGSQAVARLKILIPGTPSAQEITEDYAGSSGPTRQIDKDARPDSTNGSYRIVGQVDVNQYMIGADGGGQVITQPEIGGRGWNETSVTITLWALLDGVWGEVGQFADFRNEYYEFSGSYSVPFFFDQFVNVSSGATKFGMTASSTGQSNTLDIIRIKWTAPGTASGVRSATPDGQKAQVTITP